MCGSFSINVPIWGRIFFKKVSICVSSYVAFITSEVYIRTQKKPYASLISLLKVKFYQKLGLFQRNVIVVTTKTNFHLETEWPTIGKIAAHLAYDIYSWYKYLIVNLVFSYLGFWNGNL